MSGRVNPFANLNEPPVFATKPKTTEPVAEETVARISEQQNFPSRQAPKPNAQPKRKQRRYRTGRNRHLAIKVTEETMEKFYKAVDARGVQQGELLRLALDALEKAG